MSSSSNVNNINSDEEKISLESLIKENKDLKSQINILKEDIKMKDFKISFLEKKLNLQEEQIKSLKSSLDNLTNIKESQNKKEDIQNKELLNKLMKLKFNKDITANAPNYITLTQTFSVFKSLKGQTILSWFTKKRTIELYDLDEDILLKTINNAHTNDIHCCRHFLDTKNNNDLLITCSYDKSIKIWNIEQLDSPILTIENAHSNGFIFSPCILSHEKLSENYIISGADEELIKIFDFHGKFLEKQTKVDEYINFLDTYYDKKEDKFYIINGNSSNVKVYNFDDLSIYKIYIQKQSSSHTEVIIHENKNNEKVELIESDMKGYINIWDFHKAECLKSIEIKTIVNGICLWDENYLFCTGKDKEIKIIDLNGKIIRSLKGHTNQTISVEKIFISKYGDCLVSHDKDGIIKLWSF